MPSGTFLVTLHGYPLVHILSLLLFLHLKILEFWFIFALLPFVPPAFECSQVIDPLEGGNPYVFPLSFSLLVFQLDSVYFHPFLHQKNSPLTLYSTTVNDINKWHLPHGPTKVFHFYNKYGSAHHHCLRWQYFLCCPFMITCTQCFQFLLQHLFHFFFILFCYYMAHD